MKKKLVILIIVLSVSFLWAENLYRYANDIEKTGQFFASDHRLVVNPASLFMYNKFNFFLKGSVLIQSNSLFVSPYSGGITIPIGSGIHSVVNYENIQWKSSGSFSLHKISWYLKKKVNSGDDELGLFIGVGISDYFGSFISGKYKDSLNFDKPNLGGRIGFMTRYHKSQMGFFYVKGPNLKWNNPILVPAGNIGTKYQLDYSFYFAMDSVFSISTIFYLPLYLPNPNHISSVSVIKDEELRIKLDYEKQNLVIKGLSAIVSLYTLNREKFDIMIFNGWEYNMGLLSLNLSIRGLFPIDKIHTEVFLTGGVSFDF